MTDPCFIVELAEGSFSRRVLESEQPVLLAVCGQDHSAAQKLLKLLEEWAPQYSSRLKVFRFNTAGSIQLAERFGFQLAPGLAVFSKGALCYQFIGAVSRADLDELLARASTLGDFHPDQ